MPKLEHARREDNRGIAASFRGTGLFESAWPKEDKHSAVDLFTSGNEFLVVTIPSSCGISWESGLIDDLTSVVLSSYIGCMNLGRTIEPQEGVLDIPFRLLPSTDVTGAGFLESYSDDKKQYDCTFRVYQDVLFPEEEGFDELEARVSPPTRPYQRMRVRLKSIGQLPPRIAFDPERD